MESRSAKVGLAAVLILSLAYGYGLGLLVDGPYNDPCQGSPAMAAMALMFLGILAGAAILTGVSILYVFLATGLSGANGAAGCALVTILAAMAAVVGYLLFGARPLVQWVPPC